MFHDMKYEKLLMISLMWSLKELELTSRELRMEQWLPEIGEGMRTEGGEDWPMGTKLQVNRRKTFW